MKYYLNNDQFIHLWHEKYKTWSGPSEMDEYHNRVELLQDLYPNITYMEDPVTSNDEIFNKLPKPGYYGIIEGDEKFINLFILKEL